MRKDKSMKSIENLITDLRAENDILCKRCATMRKELRALRLERAVEKLNRIHTIKGES